MVIAGCISAGALGPTSTVWLALAACGCLWWTVTAEMPAAHLFARVKRSALFLLVIIVASGTTGSGRVLFHEGNLYLTQEGIEGGVMQSFRLLLAVWSATLFVWATRPEEILEMAERWTVRKGRPVIAAGIIALNYLPMLVQSARRIVIARKARGEPESRWLPSGISPVARSALPLFAAAFRNADMLAEAMESRCFDPLSPRSRLTQPDKSPVGFAIASGTALLLVAALIGLF
jgi:energy-coupling factor transporter transmembrane protein EcfT